MMKKLSCKDFRLNDYKARYTNNRFFNVKKRSEFTETSYSPTGFGSSKYNMQNDRIDFACSNNNNQSQYSTNLEIAGKNIYAASLPKINKRTVDSQF